MTDSIDTTADILDIRDIIARFEELESEREKLDNARTDAATDLEFARQGDGDETGELLLALDSASINFSEWVLSDEGEEFKTLTDFLEALKGYGGDEQWRGDWYPVTLIARSYFVDYCEELVKDTAELPREIPSYIAIDWKATADNLEVDYSTVELDGNEFLYR